MLMVIQYTLSFHSTLRAYDPVNGLLRAAQGPFPLTPRTSGHYCQGSWLLLSLVGYFP